MPLDKAPYPGLRSFRPDESDIFFGRDECIDAMLSRLAATRFLVVLGSSGIGKSSLVKTGFLPALHMGLLPGAGSSWIVIDFRPGQPEGSPMRNLARQLLEKSNEPATSEQIAVLHSQLRLEGPRGLLKWCRAGHLPKNTNLLLLVDQFEEIFRYQDYSGREEAEAFVALLLESRKPLGTESSQRAELPIYVILTMRSEFLGACSLIQGLPEAITEGTFLTPRMTREQYREAILGPATVGGIEIQDTLANKLLNDLSAFSPLDDRAAGTEGSFQEALSAQDQLVRLAHRADQLPVLQHALNRIWQYARGQEELERKGEGENSTMELTFDHYNAIEGLENALNAHANSVLEQVVKKFGIRVERTAELVFRALVAGSTPSEAVRRPTRLRELIDITEDEVGVVAIVEAFRAPGANFLMPEPTVPLTPATLVDISHESLIRQWGKLRGWLNAESDVAQTYLHVKAMAKLWRDGQSGFMTMPYLGVARAWRERERPNTAWAERYGDGFDLAIDFLDKSLAVERERIKSEQEVRSRRIRWRLLSAAAALIVLVAAGAIMADIMQEKAQKQADANMAIALAAYTAGDIPMLAGILEDAAEGSYIIGYRHFKNKDYEKAIPLLRKSIDEERFVASSYFLLGYISYDEKGRLSDKLSEAEDLFGKAIAANPAYVPAYYVRASLYANSGRPQAALGELRKAVLQQTKFGRAMCQNIISPKKILEDWQPLAESAAFLDIQNECKKVHHLPTSG